MIYRMITSKSVMAKIIADLDLDEDEIKISDMKSWIAEAVQKIGAQPQLDHKVKILEIKDYQVKLPCDLEKIDFVSYSSCDCGGWIPMKKATGFYTVTDRIKSACCNCMLFQDKELFPLVKNLYNLTSDEEALEIMNKDDNIRRTLSALLNLHTFGNRGSYTGTNFSNTVQYTLKPGYIMTNVPCGFIKLAYYGTYVDDDGMPMIPDLPSYFEAIYWYVAMKLLYIDYFKGKKSQALYYDAKSSWNFYCKQAYAEALMPDQNDIMGISKTWHTLYPEIDSFDTFMSTTGDNQIIYNQNSIWK